MPEVREVAHRWEEFTQYLCLGLSQDLGRTVTAPRPRKQSTDGILDGHLKRLAEAGSLEAVLRVPDAVGPITIQVDLHSRRTLTSVSIDAPGEGRAKPRINWLLRQLGDAPDGLRIEAAYPNARQTTRELLAAVRETQTSSSIRKTPRDPRGRRRNARPPDGAKARQGRRLICARDTHADVRFLPRPRPGAQTLAGASSAPPRTAAA